jgi:hypothetical protein
MPYDKGTEAKKPMTDSTILSIIADDDALEMTYGELSDWVAYGHAYDEYDSIVVDGVEASELI